MPKHIPTYDDLYPVSVESVKDAHMFPDLWCNDCGTRKAAKPKPCPFRSEIYHEEHMCNCCAECRRQCFMDI